MDPKIHISESKQELAKDFAQWMLEDIQTSTGDYHIALSGGSTPKVLFDEVSQNFRDLFPWERIHLWWGDERMVPPDDAESNYGMTHLRLISGIKIPTQNVHRIRGEENPEEECHRYGREIESYLSDSDGAVRFDLMILGLGEDGHTASIFPDHMEYLKVETPTLLARHPQTAQLRVSLSGTIINLSKKITFLVAGESKKEKVRAIIKNEQSGSLPAAFIEPVKGELHWFLDKAAAELL